MSNSNPITVYIGFGPGPDTPDAASCAALCRQTQGCVAYQFEVADPTATIGQCQPINVPIASLIIEPASSTSATFVVSDIECDCASPLSTLTSTTDAATSSTTAGSSMTSDSSTTTTTSEAISSSSMSTTDSMTTIVAPCSLATVSHCFSVS